MYILSFTDFDMPEGHYRAIKHQLFRIQFPELDDALGYALQCRARRGVPWEIEGDDGTQLSRDEIRTILDVRGVELKRAGRPRIR